MVTLCYLALLKLVWMPAVWWAFILLGVAVAWSVVGIIWWRQPLPTLSLHEQDATLCIGSRCQSVTFVRVNAIQLIAKMDQTSSWRSRFWPSFYLIYRDSLAPEAYQMVRSFAAQQMLLQRSDKEER